MSQKVINAVMKIEQGGGVKCQEWEGHCCYGKKKKKRSQGQPHWGEDCHESRHDS